MSESSSKALRFIALAFVVVSLLVLAYVWAELFYRWLLFRTENGSEPYANHVDANYFVIIPRVAFIGALVALAGLAFAFLVRRRVLIVVAVLVIASGSLADRVLQQFHKKHILVTYSEFTEHTFHPSP